MRIIKIYETIINLSPIEQYNNIDQIIMDKLKKYFELRCRGDSLITNIRGIIKRSRVRQAVDRLDGSGDVNVKYQVDAIVYHPGDILTNCQISRIDRNHSIICTHGDNVVITLHGLNILRNLKQDQRIAVLVQKVSYPTEQRKITIKGIPYSYPMMFTIYQLSDELNVAEMPEDFLELLRKKYLAIATERDALLKTDEAVRKKIISIYYPFRKPHTEPLPNTEFLDLNQFDPDAKKPLIVPQGKFLSRPPILEKSSAIISASDSAEAINATSAGEIIAEQPIRVLISLLDDYLNYIIFIRESAEEFDSEEKFIANANIWQIYNHIKK